MPLRRAAVVQVAVVQVAERASPSGGTSGNVARRDNGTLAPGPGKPTVTQEQDSDAKINEENRRLNRAMNNICRGC
jgi:hypothetical protein